MRRACSAAGVAVFDVDVEPDLADRELDIAVGEPPDLRPFGKSPPVSTRAFAWPAASGPKRDIEREVDRRPAEQLAQFVGIERIVAVLVGAGEGVRVDRELGRRQLAVRPSRYVAFALVVFLEQEPGRPKRRLAGDQLDHRRQRGQAGPAVRRFFHQGRIPPR